MTRSPSEVATLSLPQYNKLCVEGKGTLKRKRLNIYYGKKNIIFKCIEYKINNSFKTSVVGQLSACHSN